MAQYKVQDPQGNLRIIEGPDGASDDEVIKQAQTLFGSAPQQKKVPQQQQQEKPGWFDEVGAGALGGLQKLGGFANILAGGTVGRLGPKSLQESSFKRAEELLAEGEKNLQKSGLVGQAIGSLPSALTGALPAQAMTDKYLELKSKGVDDATAAKAAGMSFATNAALLATPMGRGALGGLTAGSITGAVGAVADPLITSKLLESGYPELAKQYQVDPKTVMESAVFQGIIGGALGHVSAPKKINEVVTKEDLKTPTKVEPTVPTVELPKDIKSAQKALTVELAKDKPRKGVVKRLEKQLYEFEQSQIESQKPQGKMFNVPEQVDENGIPYREAPSAGIEEQVSVDRSIPTEMILPPDVSAAQAVADRLAGSVDPQAKILADKPWLLKNPPASQEVPNFLRKPPSIPEVGPTETGDIAAKLIRDSNVRKAEVDAAYAQMAEQQKAEAAKAAEEYTTRQDILNEPLTLEPSQSSTNMTRQKWVPKSQRGSVNFGVSEAIANKITNWFGKDRTGKDLTSNETNALLEAQRGLRGANDTGVIEAAIKSPDMPVTSKYTESLVNPSIIAYQESSKGNVIPDILYREAHNAKLEEEAFKTKWFGEQVASGNQGDRILVKGAINPDSFAGKLYSLTKTNFKERNTLAGQVANLLSEARRTGVRGAADAKITELANSLSTSLDKMIDRVNASREKLGLDPITKDENYITASGRKEYTFHIVDKTTGELIPTNFQHVSRPKLLENKADIQALLAKNGYDVNNLEFKVKRRTADFYDESTNIAKAYIEGNPARQYMKESQNLLSDLDLPPEKAGRRLLENVNNYAEAMSRYAADLETQVRTKDLVDALGAGGKHQRTLDWFENEARASIRGTAPSAQWAKSVTRGVQNLVEEVSGGTRTISQHQINNVLKSPVAAFYATKVIANFNQVVQGILALGNIKGHSMNMMERFGLPQEATMPALAKATTEFFTGSKRASELGEYLYNRGVLDQAIHRADVRDTGVTVETSKLQHYYEGTTRAFSKTDQMGRYVAALYLDNILAKHIPDVKARNEVIAVELNRVIPDMRAWNKPSAFRKIFGNSAPLITALDNYWSFYWGTTIAQMKMASGRGKILPLVATAIAPMFLAGPKSSFVTSMIDAYTNVSNGLEDMKEWVTGEPAVKNLKPSDRFAKYALMKANSANNEFESRMWQFVKGGAVDALTGRDVSKAVTAPSPAPSIGSPLTWAAKVASDIPGTLRYLANAETRGPDYRKAMNFAKNMTPTMVFGEFINNLEQEAIGSASYLSPTTGKPTYKSGDTSDLASKLGYSGKERQLGNLEAQERYNLSTNRQVYSKNVRDKVFKYFQSPRDVDLKKAISIYQDVANDPSVPEDVKLELIGGLESTFNEALMAKNLTLDEYNMRQAKLKDIIIEMTVKGQYGE